ncbi:MAG: hypothetical protein MK108_14435 [Mariniblastus sp.]|nr:hypothetical protein [Mariniblastus sp.]
MNQFSRKNVVILGLATSLTGWFGISSSQGQVTLQLPTVSIFDLQTVVQVPDGGTMHLGGVQRSAYGQVDRSAGMLGGVPFAGRLFRNRAIGRSNSASNASLGVQILSLKEMEQDVLREAERQAILRRRTDPNGPVQTQQQADFITRNIGRSGTKRKR